MELSIDKNYSTIFRANLAGKTAVLKKNIFGKYRSSEVSLIRLDVHDKSDMRLLENLAKRWKTENIKSKSALNYYLNSINDNAKKKLSSESLSNSEFFAMTEQQSSFKHLNPKKILGVAQIYLDTAYLEYIQVRPKYQNINAKRSVKHVGKQLLESLKTFTNGKSIKVYSDDKVKNFYRSQGGYPDENCRDIFYL